jgi:alpha-beta hydrolase superfamily lysophospholipase
MRTPRRMMGLRQNTRRADRQSSCVRMDWSTIGCCLQRLADVLANAPFFLLGSSMGGALVLSLSARLSTEPVNASVLRRAADRWCGCILLCPMLDMALPPRPVLLVLRYLIAALCPLTQFPNFLSPVGNPSKIWKSERVIEWMETYERWGVPGGLTAHRTRGFERNPLSLSSWLPPGSVVGTRQSPLQVWGGAARSVSAQQRR